MVSDARPPRSRVPSLAIDDWERLNSRLATVCRRCRISGFLSFWLLFFIVVKTSGYLDVVPKMRRVADIDGVEFAESELQTMIPFEIVRKIQSTDVLLYRGQVAVGIVQVYVGAVLFS